ncbi:hypothetical protein HD806DRAFT_541520 [Xylariaceae sp. AK1471]|nr:hypothetical protein HD806DRAFT_541520 [Xylariaceae sp. AK1471]
MDEYDLSHHILDASDICLHTATEPDNRITCRGCILDVLRIAALCRLTVDMIRDKSIIPAPDASTWPGVTFIRGLGLGGDGSNRQGTPMLAATWTLVVDAVEYASAVGLITTHRGGKSGTWPREMVSSDQPMRPQQLSDWLFAQGLPDRLPPRTMWEYFKRIRTQQPTPSPSSPFYPSQRSPSSRITQAVELPDSRIHEVDKSGKSTMPTVNNPKGSGGSADSGRSNGIPSFMKAFGQGIIGSIRGSSMREEASSSLSSSSRRHQQGGNKNANSTGSSKSRGKKRVGFQLSDPFSPPTVGVNGGLFAGPTSNPTTSSPPNNGLFGFTAPAQTQTGTGGHGIFSSGPTLSSNNAFTSTFGNSSFGQFGDANNPSPMPWTTAQPPPTFPTQQYRDPSSYNAFPSASPSTSHSPFASRPPGVRDNGHSSTPPTLFGSSPTGRRRSATRQPRTTTSATTNTSANAESVHTNAMAEFRVAHSKYFRNPTPANQRSYDLAWQKVSRTLDPSRQPRAY